MKQLLIEEFDEDLSLEAKKDTFMQISFKPKKSLTEVADRFYVEGQQLITSKLVDVHEAYTVTVSSTMSGIIWPSLKAWKAQKLLASLTDLTDLDQMLDWKWVTAASVCQLNLLPPGHLTDLIYQQGLQKLDTQRFFANWTSCSLYNVYEIRAQDPGGIA
ncbi:hypothetical protein DSO57_1034999 [Entomophthora muscae]|uniref:Uncharacterized protein n=1 Tax=Entomophthora muscae TaxID=34485 RepID=A0ACC2SCB5_9FUNG|nr:hypothetical protein DSO57_1034999 [Entomophthora muscae]